MVHLAKKQRDFFRHISAKDPVHKLNVQVSLQNQLIVDQIKDAANLDTEFRPTLIFVQLRLGCEELNPQYLPDLKVGLRTRH